MDPSSDSEAQDTVPPTASRLKRPRQSATSASGDATDGPPPAKTRKAEGNAKGKAKGKEKAAPAPFPMPTQDEASGSGAGKAKGGKGSKGPKGKGTSAIVRDGGYVVEWEGKYLKDADLCAVSLPI